MPFDTSMYRQQPINVLDVIGGYQNLALNRQKKQANALELQQAQQAMQDKQRALEEAGVVKNILAGAGGSRDEAIKALETRGFYKPADELRKSAAEIDFKKAQATREGTQADSDRANAEKARGEQLAGRMKQYRDFLVMVKSPQEAATWISAQYNDPVVKDFVSRIPMDQMIQSIPQDAAEFEKWRNEAGMGIEKFVQNQTTIRGQDKQAATSIATNAATNQRMAADSAASRAVTMRGQDMTDTRQRELNTITKEDREASRAIEKKDRAVTDYSKTLQKEGIPDFEEALANLEDKFSKYKPGDAPGVGRVSGLVPDFLQGQEAEDMTNAIAAVKNTLLKARSGSAVSESELRRLVQELGTGGFRSEETVRNAIKSIRSRFEKVKANAVAGVSDDVKSEYESRGGTPISRGGAKPSDGAYQDPDKERRYQEWKKKQK